MNRRHFLQKSSVAAIAVAGLPLAVKARRPQQQSTATYRTTNNASSAQTLYGMTVYHNAINNFSSSSDEEKIITLGVKDYRSADRSSPSSTGDYKLTIEKVKKEKNAELWDLSVTVEKLSGDFDLPKEISKKITLRCKPGSFINILGKKGKLISELNYVEPSSSGDEDCFLTTACVHHKGLPDNCVELETLRSLREQHLRNNIEGRILIDQYGIVGPSIVKAINSCENSAEIYDYMYAHMILPSVRLVQENKISEAIEYYKNSVSILQLQYC